MSNSSINGPGYPYGYPPLYSYYRRSASATSQTANPALANQSEQNGMGSDSITTEAVIGSVCLVAVVGATVTGGYFWDRSKRGSKNATSGGGAGGTGSGSSVAGRPSGPESPAPEGADPIAATGDLTDPTRPRRSRHPTAEELRQNDKTNTEIIKNKVNLFKELSELFHDKVRPSSLEHARRTLAQHVHDLQGLEKSEGPICPWEYFTSTSELRSRIQERLASINEGERQGVKDTGDATSIEALKKIKKELGFWKEASSIDKHYVHITEKRKRLLAKDKSMLRFFNKEKKYSQASANRAFRLP